MRTKSTESNSQPLFSLPLLAVNSLTKRFPGVLALDQVSFDLEAGEIHSLCGENGAGKSTLIKCLSGIWQSDTYEGRISVDGTLAEMRGIRDAETLGIGVIYQELALVPEMTVAENLFLGSEPIRAGGFVDWNKVYQRAKSLLDEYDLKLDPSAVVGTLGVGQQQLVEIVKALAKNTRILLLDEPTAALTETEVDVLINILRALKQRGVTCVYISHKLDEVFAISDRITVFRDGRTIATHRAAETSKAEIIEEMVGRQIDDLFPRRASKPGSVVLEVSGLCVRSQESGQTLLKDVSLEVRAGEVLGIGGLMGAGRSELAMHLVGAMGRRESGDVRVQGETFHCKSPADAIARGVILVTEDRKRYGLVLEKDIGFNQSLASLAQFGRRGFIDEFAEVRRNWEFFKSLQVKAPGLEYETGALSGGNQQKVVLAKALMTQPSLIILDEPTRGIDVGAKQEVYELINQLTSEGKAVILISSELPELLGMSDRVVVLSSGQIGGVFPDPRSVTQSQILHAAMACS